MSDLFRFSGLHMCLNISFLFVTLFLILSNKKSSVGEGVQSQRCCMLLGPQTKVLNAGGLAVEASREAAWCCLQ